MKHGEHGKAAHTPEPWIYWPETGEIHAEGIPLVGETVTTKNGQRIVACVNACAGIPTEQLEAARSAPVAEDMAFREIAKQRDELLAALEAVMHSKDAAAIKAARSAIASVRGAA